MRYGRLVLRCGVLFVFPLLATNAQSRDPLPLTNAEARHIAMYSISHCGQMIPLLLEMSRRFSGTAQGKSMLDTHNFYVAQCQRAEQLREKDKLYKDWLAQRSRPNPPPTPNPAPQPSPVPTPVPTPAPTPSPDDSTLRFGKLDASGPNDQFYQVQNNSGLREVFMMKAWERNRDCGNIDLSVFDTGIDFNHSELKNSYRPQHSYDFVTNNPNGMDKHWHGTFVAGIMAGQPNNRDGIAGTCWRANVSSKTVLNSQGMGTVSDIVRAMNATSNSVAPNARVSVWNLSISIMNQVVFELSNRAFPQTITDAISNAGRKNTVVVIAAGNSNQVLGSTAMLSQLPKNLLVVGATDSTNKIANFSNYGGVVQVYAPGVNITSTASGSRYSTASGTSFSAPMAAGIIGLYAHQNPSIPAHRIVENVLKTSRSISNSKNGLSLTTPIIDAGNLMEVRQ